MQINTTLFYKRDFSIPGLWDLQGALNQSTVGTAGACAIDAHTTASKTALDLKELTPPRSRHGISTE